MIAALSLMCSAGPLAQEPASGGDQAYQLARGDKLRIVVFGHDDLSGEFQVDAEGNVAMPLVGDVVAQGLSVDELEQAITTMLQPDYLKNPRVSAELLSYRPIYIIGEVNAPGSYPFESGMSVINAVALAGGFTYRARKSRIVISRTLDDGPVKMNATESTPLQPGDVVEVPERFF